MDLQEIIGIEQAAVDTSSENDPNQAEYLDNLGVILNDRYLETGKIADLEESISVGKAAVKATLEDHPDRATRLDTLGVRLDYRYRETHSMNDLQEAICIGQLAINVTSEDHPNRAEHLDNLCARLNYRYLRTRLPNDLQEVIRIGQALIDITPEDYPDRMHRLGNHEVRLSDRYLETGSMSDLQQIIRIKQFIIDVGSEDHTNRATRLTNSGITLSDRYSRIEPIDDLQKSLTCLVQYSRQANIPPLGRLLGWKLVASLIVDTQDWEKGATYFTEYLDLLSKLVPRLGSIHDFQRTLRNLSGFSALTASVFLKAEKSALESLQALENGRGIISNLLIDTRSDISLLKDRRLDLWAEYSSLREAVAYPVSYENEVSSYSELFSTSDYTFMSLKRLEGYEKLEKIESEIRKEPGFESFQLPLTETELHRLARYGPIVSFNVTNLGSHAFLVTDNNVRVIQLPKLMIGDLENHTSRMTGGNQSRRDVKIISADGIVDDTDYLARSMCWLWDVAVKPVLEELGLLWRDEPPATLPCVWWVGGGVMALLPLHAAGEHRLYSTDNTMSHVVSSYAPTFKALLFSQGKLWTPLTAKNTKVLIVTMPKTPGLRNLNVRDEVAAIEQHIGSCASIEVLEAPTRAAVLRQVTACSLVHFACHGSSDSVQPSESALYVGTGSVEKLTVDDLQSLNHQLSQVAYLSACSTAEIGTRDLIDESIHLASSFQLVGFRHVIGTMWGADDMAAVAVAAKFYENLLKQNVDTISSVPRALHHAILDLKAQNDNSDNISIWAPFIHLGP